MVKAPRGPVLNFERALRVLGQHLRDRRKELGVSAIAASEAAGISRVTLYRIEKGEATVAIGAYMSVVSALGLALEVNDPKEQKRRLLENTVKLPAKIRVASYAQLKKIAWQIRDTKEVTSKEALELYERNWRHVDFKSMDERERAFLKALLAFFGRERLLV